MTADTATLPLPSDTNALDAVKSASSIVVAAPVIVACLESIWVCIALVTPSTYPNSVEVTAEAATLPLPSDTSALLALRLPVVIVETAPAMFATRLASLEADHATLMGNSNGGY